VLLLLIRHGTTALTATRLVGRTPGVSLDDNGRVQALDLVQRLENVPIAALYSSPLERTRETAEPLAAARNLPVRVEDRLVEVDFGEWQGQEYRALQKTDLWKRVQSRPGDARFPAGEAVREAQARVVAAVEGLLHDHPSETVAAFSHSDLIKLAVAHYTGVHIDLFQRLSISPASVTALWLGGGMPRLVNLNDTGGLAHLRPARRARRRVSTATRHN
jgi:probable phosphomutase (TIGR03848 family)